MTRRGWFLTAMGLVAAGVVAAVSQPQHRKYVVLRDCKFGPEDQASLDHLIGRASGVWVENCEFDGVNLDLSKFTNRQYALVDCRFTGGAAYAVN